MTSEIFEVVESEVSRKLQQIGSHVFGTYAVHEELLPYLEVHMLS